MAGDSTTPFDFRPTADLSQVLAAYLEAVDRGDKPERTLWLTRYPHLAEQLQQYFDQEDSLNNLTGEVRTKNQAVASALAYDLLEEINRGGMGVVLRCRDRDLNRDLAIKVLLDQFRDQPDLVRRFIEEARITGQLQHPFIVPVHKFGLLPDGRPYFAMKLVQGRTFAELLRERATPAQDLPRFLQVLEQVCQTIAYAHSKGVIHRDLKPANVMVGAFGEVQVMDWGLAKILDEVPAASEATASETSSPGEARPDQTHPGSVMGTYAYMPPEQACGLVENVSRRSDVFGLGAILCEVLTGAPPYEGELTAVQEKARQGRIEEALARLDACGADAELILLARRCLAVEPEERPAEGAAVAEALARHFTAVQERLRSAEIARARAETEAIEERKRLTLAEAKVEAERKRHQEAQRRRRATALLALSLLLLLVLGVGFGAWYQVEHAAREAELAERRSTTERDVAAALAEIRLRREEGLQEADHPQRWKATLTRAWDAWKRAENVLLLGEATESLRAELVQAKQWLEQDERDRQLLATLERLWLEAGMLSGEDVRAQRNVSRWLQTFREYGLNLEGADPQAVAARIRQHPQRARLVQEIDIIAQLQVDYCSPPRQKNNQLTFKGVVLSKPDWSKAEHLRLVLDAVEGNPEGFGARWRAARLRNDRQALVAMAQSVEVEKLSPHGVAILTHDLTNLHAFGEALTMLRLAHLRHPTDFWVNQMLGMLSMLAYAANQGGSPEEAVRHLTAALAIRGDNPATYIMLSRVLNSQGKMEDALRAAKAAVKADPLSAPAHHNVGSLYFDRKDWDTALKWYLKAADLDPVSPLPFDSLGQTYYQLKEHDRAIRHYEIAIQREPTFAGSYLNWGNALAEKGDLEGAIAQYRQALKVFPSYGLAHYNLGHALLQKKEYREALTALDNAILCDPRYPPAHYALGKIKLLWHRDVAGAIQCYQKVVDLYPELPQAHFQLADLLQGLGRNFEAETSLRRVIKLNEKYPEAHYRLGFVLAARQDWKGAEDAYRIAVKEENLSAAHKAVVHDGLGLALFNRGQWEESIQQHQLAIGLAAETAMFHHNLGVAQMVRGDLEDATASFQKAVDLDAKNPLFALRLGRMRLELREWYQALQLARTTVKLAPQSGEAYQLLASVQYDLGDYTGGLKTVEEGQKAVPPSDPTQGLLRLVRQAGEAFLQGEEKLPGVLRGTEEPADAQERLTLAMICGLKQRQYAAASRLFAESFAALPLLAEKVSGGARYHAACCAARAGTGAEKDAPLDATAQARLRGQALEWLRADLEGSQQALKFALPPEQGQTRFRVRRWLKEPHLEKVRHPDHLAQLPGDEREKWSRLWVDVAAFGSNAPPKAPAGPNLARLRKLAAFPTLAMAMDVQFDSGKRDAQGRPIVKEKQRAELQAKLNGSVQDAEVLLELAQTYNGRTEKAQVQELARKAEALLQPYLKTTKPSEAIHLLHHAHAQTILHPNQDQEHWIRQAVKLNPQDWRSWQRLSSWSLIRAENLILENRPWEETQPNEHLKKLHSGQVPSAVLVEVEKLVAEARRHSSRARELAPKSAAQWDRRIAFLFQEAEWLNALRVARGKSPLPLATGDASPELVKRGFPNRGALAIESFPELAQELREAAERCPDHVGMQVFGFMMLIPRIKARVQDPSFQREKDRPLFTPQESEFLEETQTRLEKIAQAADGEGALYCQRVLGLFHLHLAMLDDATLRLPRAEAHLRRVLEMDPKDTDSADALEFALTQQGRKEAALEVAKQRLASVPSTRNRFLVARALQYCGQAPAAEKALQEALKDDPQNAYLLTARAALWLKESTEEKSLEEASRLLERARAALQPSDRKELTEDLDFLGALCQALSGRQVLARLTLESLQALHQKESRYREALEALGALGAQSAP